MQAIVQERYGPPDQVLSLRQIDPPTITDDQILLRVHAAAVAGDDWHLMRGRPILARGAMGLRHPKQRLPGRDVAGRVETVGAGVTEFQPGDEVFGWCDGAFAEYAAVSPNTLAAKPENLSLEEAAVVPVSGFTALQALRDKGGLQAGQQLLIIGASGGVGSFAVQIGKALGAEVTGVCGTASVDLVRSLGADHVIDYTRADYTQGERRYDLIVDLVANRPLSHRRRVLQPRGTLVLPAGAGGWPKALLVNLFVRQKLRPFVHADRKDDLLVLKTLIEEGKLRPIVSARYPLAEVASAVEHFAAGHGTGKVAITVAAGAAST